MQKLAYMVLVGIISLMGCSSKVTLTTTTRDSLAKMSAGIQFCKRIDYIDNNDSQKVVSILKNYIIPQYNIDTNEISQLDRITEQYNQQFSTMADYDQMRMCRQLNAEMADYVNQFEKQQSLALENQRLQQQGLQDMSDMMNNNMNRSSYNYPTYSTPTLQPMQVRGNASTHGLINTSSGLKQCTTTPSGYTLCH